MYLARGLDDVAHTTGLPEAVVEELVRGADASRQAASALRKLIHGLRPPILDDLGLVPAVRQLIEQAGERAGLTVRLQVTGPPSRLPANIELTAYRVVQESLNNVLHHAQARAADVALRFGRDLVVSVADNGRGFDLASVGQGSGGLGLTGMSERVESVDGVFNVRSSPDGGTRVCVTLPFTPSPIDEPSDLSAVDGGLG